MYVCMYVYVYIYIVVLNKKAPKIVSEYSALGTHHTRIDFCWRIICECFGWCVFIYLAILMYSDAPYVK